LRKSKESFQNRPVEEKLINDQQESHEYRN